MLYVWHALVLWHCIFECIACRIANSWRKTYQDKTCCTVH